MVSENLKNNLKKQHYSLVGNHTAVQICRWNKKSLVDEGFCYKQKFYGIKSHQCCQMSPAALFCQNKCIHCWRAIELTEGTTMKDSIIDSPENIANECVISQKKLLSGFKGNKKINYEKFKESQEPMHFAISLIGEPTLYPKLGEFIQDLRKKGKTSFLVTNGLNPKILIGLKNKKQLPTQLYISLNTPNKKMYENWHKSAEKKAWKKFNESLEIIKSLKGKTRTVLRLTLVKDMNMEKKSVEEFAKLIKKAQPDFIEAKGFMSVGFSRKRLGYEKMPRHNLIRSFSKDLIKELNKKAKKDEKNSKNYKILDEYEKSAIVLLGKDKKRMKIRKDEI